MEAGTWRSGTVAGRWLGVLEGGALVSPPSNASLHAAGSRGTRFESRRGRNELCQSRPSLKGPMAAGVWRSPAYSTPPSAGLAACSALPGSVVAPPPKRQRGVGLVSWTANGPHRKQGVFPTRRDAQGLFLAQKPALRKTGVGLHDPGVTFRAP